MLIAPINAPGASIITLYVKTHNVTGLKYFGKTTAADPFRYRGSGKYWKRHLAVHGNDVTTTILGVYEDPKECERVAEQFSLDNNIVESTDWANLRAENGRDGAPVGHKGYQFSNQERAALSTGLRARWSDANYRQKLSSAQQRAWSEERKRTQAERLRTIHWTEEQRRHQSKKMKGRTNAKTSATTRGVPKPDGFGERVAATLRGRPKPRACRLIDRREMSANALVAWCNANPLPEPSTTEISL